ncbi:MAG: hypothetical protein LIO39_05305, partial [Lachnospiraceae bacterium]|nr:hypothetical protein [Lachnospiraceae bacterium]
MRQNALGKDIFRTIKKEKKRFFSIMLITALGVAMMTGLTSACNDLRWSADALYDGQNLFDIEVSSTLGLDDDDIAALEGLDEVSAVEGEYSATVYVEVNGVHEQAKVRTLGETINVPTVLEGALPQAADEIAVTESYLDDTGKQVGDTLTFTEAGTGEDEDAVFADTEYTITAEVLDPFDVNNREGSVSFRSSASEEYTFFVSPLAADTDLYTAVYLTVEDADLLMCYTDEYEQLISDVKTKINTTLKEQQQQNRYDTVYGEALAEYNDALAEVLDELADAQAEIDDGWAELQDGLDELNDGKAELEEQEASADRQIADGLAQIQSGYESLAAAKEQLDASAQQLADGAAQLSEGKDELEQTKEETLAQIDAGVVQYEAVIEQLKAQKEALEAQEAELTAQKEELESALAEAEAGLAALQAQRETAVAQFAAAEEEIAAQEAALAEGQAQYESGMAQWQESQATLDENKAALEEQAAEAEEQFADAWEEIEENEQKLADAEQELIDAQEELDESTEEAMAELEEAKE